MHWYDDLPHLGYNINGKKVLRPAKGDELDRFLQTVEDPNSWYTIISLQSGYTLMCFRTTAFDKNTQMDKPLSAEELDIIRRLQAGENPDAEYDPYEPTIEWFTGKGKEEVMPLSSAPEPKRRWLPSKWEKQKVYFLLGSMLHFLILFFPDHEDCSCYPPGSNRGIQAYCSG